ncbi:ATP-binding protein [Rossellomorea marisflavi]|uniref:ATP-binding protein n=1 Tax=Rossellomorea marisflavi TaxID=189381 RepID=UPI00064E8CFB|nr:ATP-binding protein [Rossellomorea marisflavi]KML03179.1 hypothetical protein VL06_16220 [Rossellomorea marisflavi]
MRTEIVDPYVGNFVKSLREIGYTFEVAVADVLDNSITAYANNINILVLPDPEKIFMMLDDGVGMSEGELINSMRLAANDPDLIREEHDLGKFGLGLKTASFSQCKKLTVISKKNNNICIKQWDLDFISKENKWLLITPELEDYSDYPLFSDLFEQDSGTLVIWENIDSFSTEELTTKIYDLKNHLSLVFHNFMEGKAPNKQKINITVNMDPIKPFNPFNPNHKATQELEVEKITFKNAIIKVQPFILPHHSKLSQQEFDRYATPQGYTQSQGFYLYRGNRLLIHGTWWGMHKMRDAHRLVRIKIDIPNSQDAEWGIDIKKSTAKPVLQIKNDLKRIIHQVTIKGSRPYTGRGRIIKDSTIIRFWNLEARPEGQKFVLNRQNPILKDLLDNLDVEKVKLLNLFLMGVEGYLPLDTITAQLYSKPHELRQEPELSNEELGQLVESWRETGISEDFIGELLKTEIFLNNKEFVIDEK